MVKRYDFIQFADVCEMRESEDGDYILHTDHAEAMAAAEAEISWLREGLNNIKNAEERSCGRLSSRELLEVVSRMAKAALAPKTPNEQEPANAHA